MGYDSRLYVIEKGIHEIHNMNGEKVQLSDKVDINGELVDMYYAFHIATFELGCVRDVSSKFRSYPVTDSYIYTDDGDKQILLDHYDQRLTEIPLDEAVRIIEEAVNTDDYRRWTPVLASLKILQDSRERWAEIVVLHYGH